MAEPLKPVFQRVQQLNTLQTDGSLQKNYVITFMVGTQGPFTETIPGNEFNAANVQAAMQKIADEINQLPMGS